MLGGVFISYRREDSAGFAGRIYDRLTRRLDQKSVFLDVDNIQPGLDFFEVLSEKLRLCNVLIAVIGRNWNSIADRDNRRRLDDPDDFVRIEIEAALERGIRVIPVLVDGATMPKARRPSGQFAEIAPPASDRAPAERRSRARRGSPARAPAGRRRAQAGPRR